MLDFELPLTKADKNRALVFTLVRSLDDFLSGANYRERRIGHGVATLEPNESASLIVGKIKSTLIKIATCPDVDTDELVSVLKDHGYQFGFDKQPNPFDTRVIVSTPRGVLSFPLMIA
jgi:hypothetical protein